MTALTILAVLLILVGPFLGVAAAVWLLTRSPEKDPTREENDDVRIPRR